jgi:predicted  nucleic acid-binding Zn-ribbon protein
MLPDLKLLIRLQELDSAAERLRRRMADLPAAQAALNAQLADLTGAVASVKERTSASQAARRDIEKDLAAVQARLNKYKDQLMEVKTNKEYHAMQTEITAAEALVRREEDRLLERMEEAETFAAELKAAEAALKSGQAQLKGSLQQMETDRVDTEQDLEKTSAERAQVAAAVSVGVLALFERVSKHRKGLAMSEARDGLCTQCHVRLRPQVYNELRRNESVMQCESCSRILFFLAAPGVSPPASTPEARSAPAEPGS